MCIHRVAAICRELVNSTEPPWGLEEQKMTEASLCHRTKTNLPNTHHIIVSVWVTAMWASGQCMWLTHSSYKHMPTGTDWEFFSKLILMENIDLSKLKYCSGNVHTNFSIQTLICCRIISITVAGFSPETPRSCSE